MNDLNSVEDLVPMSSDAAEVAATMSSTLVGRDFYRYRGGRQSGLTMGMLRDNAPLFENTAKRRRHLAAKRAFDVIMSALALLALLPLLTIVAALVLISSRGPVFFRQEREGHKGRPFQALKFRSMYVENCDISGVAQTVNNDPRVTPIGSFLRRTSIDELPQLINVLQGDMSLVGPRPHVKGMYAGGVPYRDLVPYYDLRLEMTPGLTGWAQANGLRGPTHRADRARARIDHDLAYIQNFSFWLDMRIIAQTLHREFIGGSGH